MEDKPLTRQDLKYVDQFRKTRDVTKAGSTIGLGSRNAKRMHNRIEIQEEIERQDNVVMAERAKVQVAAETLTNDVLDREHMKVILLDEKEFGALKLEAIKLGNVITGRIQAGSTRILDVLPPPTSDDDPRVNFYQAFVTVQPAEAAPILPPEHKDHQFAVPPPPAKLSKPEPVTGTVAAERPAGKVRIF